MKLSNNKYIKRSGLISSIFAGLVLIILGSCNEEKFLTVVPEDLITADNYYMIQEDIMSTLTAAYSSVGDESLYSNYYLLQRDLLSDLTTTRESSQQIAGNHNFDFSENDSWHYQIWVSLYKGIRRVNEVLARTPEALLSEPLIQRAHEEARFLRSLYYWHLLQGWRDVPIRTPENMDIFAVEKSPREDVYAFIESELESIVENDLLPADYSGGLENEKGRATIGAAKALLGKVYLYQEKFSEAQEQFADVIAMDYELIDDPEYIWHIDSDNHAKGKENIFEVQFDNTVGGPNGYFDDGPDSNEGSMRWWFYASGDGAYLNIRPNGAAVSLYNSQPGDRRRTAFIRLQDEPIVYKVGDSYDTTIYTSNIPVIKKGLSTRASGIAGTGENAPVIRLADVYLMYAEAIVRGGGSEAEAAQYVDSVRARAFGEDYIPVLDLKASTGKSLFELIKEERAKEFAFEGHRFNDLRRWGNLDRIDRFVSGREYYPIPQAEINVSGGLLVQDPSY